MPIEDLQHRYRELGRLKFGEDLGDRPAQLETWRLTSPDHWLIDRAAEIFGGTAQHLEQRAEVTTETSELEVLVPPQDIAGGQFYELWKAGGLERRCTGTALIEFDDSPAGFTKIAPCVCEEENSERRACKVSTTLRVLLPQLPDIGIWRLHTGSVYAAAEIPPAVEVLTRISRGQLAPAVLGLEKRSSKKRGQSRHNYMIPVLRSRQSLEALLADPTPAGLQALPFDQAPAELLPPASQPGEGPPPPAPPPQSLETPPGHPLGPETPSRPPPSSTEAKKALWDELRSFLELTPPGDAPHERETLIEVLSELERLTLATGLWRGDPLDAAANHYLRGRYWKGDQVTTEELRSFAQRALMAANTDLEKSRLAR